ncbi:unnamed protein product [Bathycoccus prasinos]
MHRTQIQRATSSELLKELKVFGLLIWHTTTLLLLYFSSSLDTNTVQTSVDLERDTKDFTTVAALYSHHQYIAGFIMCGAFAHGAIFFIRDYDPEANEGNLMGTQQMQQANLFGFQAGLKRLTAQQIHFSFQLDLVTSLYTTQLLLDSTQQHLFL